MYVNTLIIISVREFSSIFLGSSFCGAWADFIETMRDPLLGGQMPPVSLSFTSLLRGYNFQAHHLLFNLLFHLLCFI